MYDSGKITIDEFFVCEGKMEISTIGLEIKRGFVYECIFLWGWFNFMIIFHSYLDFDKENEY